MPKRTTKPRNPYIAGGIVKGVEFVGRDEILHSVQEFISQPDQNAILLTGPRRIGKTSILYKLREDLPKDQYVAVYFDLMGMADKKLSDLLHLLASEIAHSVGIAAPRKAKNFTLEGGFIQKVYTAIGDKRLIILLDEFDTLDYVTESPREEEFAANLFMDYVRNLLANPGRLTFVVVLGRNLTDMSGKVHGLFKASLHQRVSVLTRAEAVRLVQSAERNGSVHFDGQAIDRILELTNGHPYFSQIFCHTAFQRTWEKNLEDGPIPVVTSELIDEIIPEILVLGGSAFQWIWEGIPPAEKIVLSTLASLLPKENSTATRNEISKMLEEKRLRVLTGELKIAPDNLVKWEILKKIDDDHYCFFVEIFRRWIQIEKRLDQVSSEINRVNPRVETKFRAAQAAHLEGAFKEAITDYREAIRLNPAHVDARIGLARALFEDQMVDQSIEEYESAYQYSQEATEEFLVPVLLSRATAREAKGELIEALNDYERVLQISKNNTDAIERKASVISQLGDQALSDGRIEEAESYYTAAGLKGKREGRIQAKRYEQLMQKKEEEYQLSLRKTRRDSIFGMILASFITLFIAGISLVIFAMAYGYIKIPAILATNTPTITPSPSSTPSQTSTPTASATFTASPTATASSTPTHTTTPTATYTPWPSQVSLSTGLFDYVDVTSNGQYIVIGSQGGVVAIWEADPNRLLREIDNAKLGFGINAIDFSPDDLYIIVATNSHVYFYDRQDLSVLIRDLPITTSGNYLLDINPSREFRHIAILDSKGNLEIRDWNTNSLLTLPEIENFQFTSIREVTYSSDGSSMAILKQDSSLWIWDLENNIRNVSPPVLTITKSPSYSHLQWKGDSLLVSYTTVSASVASDFADIWNTSTIEQSKPKTIALGVCSNCSGYSLSEDGSLLIKFVNYSDSTSFIYFIDRKSGAQLSSQDGKCTRISDLAYVNNKKELIVVGNSGCVNILLLPQAISTPSFTPTPTLTLMPSRTPTLAPPTATLTLQSLQP